MHTSDHAASDHAASDHAATFPDIPVYVVNLRSRTDRRLHM